MAAADSLRAMVEKIVTDLLPLRQLNVTAVYPDGTVDLGYGSGGDVLGVPCASSYASRKAGDKVWVIRAQAGNWEVLCRSEAPDPSPPAP